MTIRKSKQTSRVARRASRVQNFVRIGIIADDLTGAGDAGMFFTRFGTPLITGLDFPKQPSDRAVWIINTNSRLDTNHAAAKKVIRASLLLKKWGATHVYKKVDSALRGPIGAELSALITTFHAKKIPLILAYPRMGRTVKNGFCLIHGIPVHKTAFSKDPANPVSESLILNVLKKTCPHWKSIEICDCFNQKQMQIHAQKYSRSSLVAGSAGFAEEWVKTIPLKRASRIPCPAPLNPAVVVISGSHHLTTQRQLEYLRKNYPSQKIISVPKKLQKKNSLMHNLIKKVTIYLKKTAVKRWIIAGGQTAMRVLDSHGMKALNLYGRVEYGTSHCGWGDLHVVLKPGGMGNKRTLARCLRYLKNLK